MSYSLLQRHLTGCAIVYLEVSVYNVATSVGDAVQFTTATDLVGSSASAYSFSSGVVTLPSGYWYWLKGTPQCRFADYAGYAQYQWKTSGGTALGRRGTLITQESAQLFGGDDIACCLVDATSASQDVKLVYDTLSNVTNTSNNVYPTYAGMTRAEVWRLDP